MEAWQRGLPLIIAHGCNRFRPNGKLETLQQASGAAVLLGKQIGWICFARMVWLGGDSAAGHDNVWKLGCRFSQPFVRIMFGVLSAGFLGSGISWVLQQCGSLVRR